MYFEEFGAELAIDTVSVTLTCFLTNQITQYCPMCCLRKICSLNVRCEKKVRFELFFKVENAVHLIISTYN